MLNNTPADSQDTPEVSRPVVSSRLILWLVVFSLGLLFVPLYVVSTTIKQNNVPLVTQLAMIGATLTSTPPPDPLEAPLKSTLAGVQKQINALNSIQPTLVAGHTDWAATISVIARFDPTLMALTGVTQSDRQIIITGQAGSEATVMTYADTLRNSDQFSRVVLQSISSKTLPPSATPSSTPTLAPTPTPASTEVAPAAAPTMTATLIPTQPGDEFHPLDKLVDFTIIVDRKVGAK